MSHSLFNSTNDRSTAFDQPAAELIRSPVWIAALLVLVGVLAFAYSGLLAYSYTQWLKPDYSHGFLVPIFSIFLAYHWRTWAPARIRWLEPWSLAFIVAGTVLFVLIGKLNIAKEWLQGFSLVLNLCGVVLLLGGWKSLQWLWPSLAFLMFMFPLPDSVERKLGWELQKTAAIASEFTLQTIGYPTVREGVVLHVKENALEVHRACSGLSMLLTFLALSTGMALLVKRPWFDRVLILVSAIPVAVVANVIRISLTGVLYTEGGRELGERVFHDFAGWMMMPIAILILWIELKILDWVLVDQGEAPNRDEVIKSNVANPAHLFMTAWPQENSKSAASASKPAALPLPDEPPKGASR